jgi:hypothetical protein
LLLLLSRTLLTAFLITFDADEAFVLEGFLIDLSCVDSDAGGDDCEDSLRVVVSLSSPLDVSVLSLAASSLSFYSSANLSASALSLNSSANLASASSFSFFKIS